MVGSYQEQMAAPPAARGRERVTTSATVAMAATAVRRERAGRHRRDQVPTTTWTEGRCHRPVCRRTPWRRPHHHPPTRKGRRSLGNTPCGSGLAGGGGIVVIVVVVVVIVIVLAAVQSAVAVATQAWDYAHNHGRGDYHDHGRSRHGHRHDEGEK